MIPILYNKNETEFITQGIGSLSDATTCVVSEERNGQFELEMTYPVIGKHFHNIVLDNIIFAKPSDGKDPQPFQIYDISTPINGIITIKARHISYRLSYIPITPFSISGAIQAAQSIKNHESVSSPFSISTDITNSSSRMTIKQPMSFRECLGGVEGSFIDTFGGEIEWDKFQVKIKAHRGKDNNVRISYSKNLEDFSNQESNDNKVTAILPYWHDSETGENVIGNVIDAVKTERYEVIELEYVFNHVESDSVPQFEQNKYFKLENENYILLKTQPSDWSTNYIDYYTLNINVPEFQNGVFAELKEDGKYYKNNFLIPVLWEENTYYKVKDKNKYKVQKVADGENIPDFGYLYFHIEQGETIPSWEANKYYEYSEELEDYILIEEQPDDWNTNYFNYYYREAKYYSINSFGYFNIPEVVGKYSKLDSDNMPDYQPNKYYTMENDVLILVTGEQPSDWYTAVDKYYFEDKAPEFEYDKYYSKDQKSFGLVQKVNPPEWVPDKYYKLENSQYILTDSEPEGWDDENNPTYTNYYTKREGSDPAEYDRVPQIEIPTYEIGKYYEYSVDKSEYVCINDEVAPNNWSTSYFTYYILNSSSYSLLTSKPHNWNEEFITPVRNNYSSMPTYEPQKYYRKESGGQYVRIDDKTAPVDWNSNYNDYYHGIQDYGFKYYYYYIPVSYTPIFEKPSDWETNYFDYYEQYIPEQDPNYPIYILTDEEPNDWYDIYDNAEYGCNKYYTKYTQTTTKDYSLLNSKPSDWDKRYYNPISFNSYIPWESYKYYKFENNEYSLLLEQPDDWGETSAVYYIYSRTNYYKLVREIYDEDLAYRRITPHDFSSIFQYKPSKILLENYARNYLKGIAGIENELKLDVSFVALWQTEEYKNIAHLERVNLCDEVTIDFPDDFGMKSKKLKVIQTTFDVLADRYTNIKLGNSTSSLATTVAGIQESIQEEVKEASSTLADSIVRLVDAMMGGRGGFMKIEQNNGKPAELIFGDTDNPLTMTNCLRINYKGIAFSQNGIYGDYTSVWGLNGEFDGQCIKAGTIHGNAIKAGTITADSFSTTVRDELLGDVTDRITNIEDLYDNFKSLTGVIRIETVDDKPRLYIGNGDVYMVQEVAEINGIATAVISFFKREIDKNDYRIGYISGEKFYTTNFQLGGYLLSGSDDPDRGLSFIWNGQTTINGG